VCIAVRFRREVGDDQLDRTAKSHGTLFKSSGEGVMGKIKAPSGCAAVFGLIAVALAILPASANDIHDGMDVC
jgi:hypothetical protein